MKCFPRALTLTLTAALFPLTTVATTLEKNYCIALRGNGELMPAHLGALSKTVETFGVPQMMAGGSSASFSTFLMESILMNPEIAKIQDPQEKADKVAFMLKSVQGIIELYFSDPQWKALFEFFNVVSNTDHKMEALKVLMALKLDQKEVQEQVLQDLMGEKSGLVMQALETLAESEIFYGPAIKKAMIRIALWQEQPEGVVTREEVTLRLQQIQKAISVLGKFDAKNDNQLLIRDGVVNFEAIANSFGYIGDMLSLRGVENNEVALKAFNEMMADCSQDSRGRLWNDLVSNTNCAEKHKDFAQAYRKEAAKTRHTSRLDDQVGNSLRALISTSVIIGDSAKEMKALKQELDKKLTSDIGSQLSLNNADIKFGYWGRETDLTKIQAHFRANKAFGQVDKSQRMMSLKQTAWKNALSLSPAEPGLSAFKEFKISNSSQTVLSAGGWSDLHPVLVLKGAGCEKVIYVTRRGADSLFAMGLAKRLFGFNDISWEQLDPHNNDIAKKFVNNGDRSDMTSQWSKMYNLANPKSSMSVSLRNADAVQCTNWNSFDIKKDFRAMIADAYQAPFYLQKSLEYAASSVPAVLQKSDLVVDQKLGYPVYSGCIPQ